MVSPGKARTVSHREGSYAEHEVHWVSEKPEFSPDGKVAFMRGADEMTVRGPDGAPKTVHLRGVSVWRKDGAGEWRCAMEVSNEEPQKH